MTMSLEAIAFDFQIWFNDGLALSAKEVISNARSRLSQRRDQQLRDR